MNCLIRSIFFSDISGNNLFNKFGPLPGSNDNSFCFDPTLFALIAGGFFLVEICGFSACMFTACRWKRHQQKPIVSKKCHISIHYENSTDESDISSR